MSNTELLNDAHRLRAIIVDDHDIFRTGIRAALDKEIEIIGEAANVNQAVRIIHETLPDIVLLDVHLPKSDDESFSHATHHGASGGAQVLEQCKNLLDQVTFLALSVSDSAEDVVGIIRAGARGYITKSSTIPDVISAIKTVAGGDAVFSPKLAGFVLDAFGAAAGEQAETVDDIDRLSPREFEVMRFIARGYTYKEVAEELFISQKTVESHVSAVLKKLQMSNRHELTAWAIKNKLL